MNRKNSANREAFSNSRVSETLSCRNAAMDRYCQLFARGFFPIMVEEAGGVFRVLLMTDERQ